MSLKIKFPIIFFFLLLVAVFTFPSVFTWSKYVWKDNIGINLKVNYSEQQITSYNDVSSNMTCTLIGSGIKIEATSTSGQWILSPEEGYILPKSFIVKIGENEYTVYTDGQGCPAGISFSQESGKLSISEPLINDNMTVIIIANGLSDLN